ncbi:ADP-ribosyl cyclase/cyclic ADP-ribose hydrolase 1 [Suncus etruscus]|uniref:ADP-ribosyl cyclase/cyclic ADP-ribose hydrolase 1 n=1 Tax=Suncus etruscus TaxID=109475 RepID=UPI00211035F6|nr:ADP-ribosyl cyclase/cyclic ADP-ribose hydrolase 1 [Suncus etruscus]
MAQRGFHPVSGERSGRCSRNARIGLCVGLSVAVIATVVAVLVWHQGRLQKPPPPQKWKGRGTTSNFSHIVLGRCYTYIQFLRPELRNRDCRKIEEAFRNAFLSKNPCQVTEQDYAPLIKLINQTVDCNKTVFWSRSKELVHQYTRLQKTLFTLEDTLLGYLADDLDWCGDAGSSEMNYDSCPLRREDCPASAVSVFWTLASRKFAEDACGMVHVMLNGSLSTPFNINSTFGSVEILNLQPKRVHTLQAWVTHNIGEISRDSCTSSSINDLRSIVNNMNITFVCQNNYRSINFLQCVKNPEHFLCG